MIRLNLHLQRLLKDSPDLDRVLHGQHKVTDKIQFICPKHGPFKRIFSEVRDGKGCPKCARSKANFKPFSETRYYNPNIEFLTPYTSIQEGGKYKVYKLRCKVCSHVYESNLVVSTCPKCAISTGLQPPTRSAAGSNPSYQLILESKGYTVLSMEPTEPKPTYTVSCNNCSTVFQSQVNGSQVTMCPKCSQGGYVSSLERSIQLFLTEHSIEFYSSYRQHGLRLTPEGRPFEIDLFIPSLSIGIEINGYFWHHSGSLSPKTKFYHARKTSACLSNGIKLYHFWEDTPLDLILSIIKSKLKLQRTFPARSCGVISNNLPSSFLNKYHVDGDTPFTLTKFYLTNQDHPVCCLSLRHYNSGKDKGVAEIARFATIPHLTIVGGYSRLLKHAISYLKRNGFHTLISFANRDLTPDPFHNFYYNYGFHFLGDVGPIMKYYTLSDTTINGTLYRKGSVLSRHTFQKHKLLKEVPHAIGTEIQIAEGIFNTVPVYNSGNLKYKLNI